MGRRKNVKQNRRKSGFRNPNSRNYVTQVNGHSSSLTARRNVTDNRQDSTADNTEIPGYYFDPETNTHFRITPENAKYFKEKKLRVQNRKSTEKLALSKPKHRNAGFCKTNQHLALHIIDREYQNVKSEVFCKRVLFTRLKMMKEVCCTQSQVDFIPLSCQTMVGNPSCGSVIGTWTTPDGTILYNYKLKKEVKNNSLSINVDSSIVGIYFNHVMSDLCVAKLSDGLEFVLCVGNPMRPSTDSSNNYSIMHLSPVEQLCDLSTPENRFTFDSMTINMEHSETAIWSCAWNQEMQKLAFGCEESIMVMSLQSLDWPDTSLAIPKENGFSVEFDKTGNTLFCGTNKGILKGFDLRTKKQVLNMKLNRGLSYLKLLSCDQYAIASCYDHKLYRVDLRTTKVVAEYTGHNNEHLKLPFSISENNGFLCSVGQDRFTRIWNLNTGDLLSTTPPPAQCGSYHPYVWFSEEWQFDNGSFDTAVIVNAGQEFIALIP